MNKSIKILSVLLCGLVMAGCAVNKNGETETAETELQVSETSPAETTAAVTSETTEAPVTTVTEDKNKVIFTNPKEPEDPIEFKGEGKKLLVYQNGEKIAEVTSEHEVESEPEGRYEDFNFDGHEDLFLYDTPSEFRHYGGECWLWDEKKGEFVKTDKLDGLFGYGIDTEFSHLYERIRIIYTEHYDYAVSYICKAEFKWNNGVIVPVSLEKTADDVDQQYIKVDKTTQEKSYTISQFISYTLDEVYKFDQKNQPVLKSRTHAKKYGGRENEEENEADLRYFRITSDSVQCMNGDSVVQNIPLKNAPELIAQYRMRKFRSSDYPLYFNDLVFSVDYDYDGYKDLCITAGVNEYGMADKFIYYHYDPYTGMFSEWDELNNVFGGEWICSEESHRFRTSDKYYNFKPKEEYSKLSCDKYTPSGSGEFLETRWYVWNNGKLELENTDVLIKPLSHNNSVLSFNAPADGTASPPTRNPYPEITGGDGGDVISFAETLGLFSAESADDVETKIHGGSYHFLSNRDVVDEMTAYVHDGYSHEIADGNLIIKTPQISQTITIKTFYDTQKVVYADFNFDGYVDFYTCDLNCYDGYYYLWNPETDSFEQSIELKFESQASSYGSRFLKPDYENKTLTVYFPKDSYNGNQKESVTLKWEDNKLVPVSAVYLQYSRVFGHKIIRKCHYKYDENYDLILTGTEETVYEVRGEYDLTPLVSRKKEFEDISNEKHFRFTDHALQYMKGNSIIQAMSYSDIFGYGPDTEPDSGLEENIIPGDKFFWNKYDYAEWDIDFDGTDDLCIYGYVKRPGEERRTGVYSYYLFDKSTGMYRKWDLLSEKGYLYLPNYHEKMLFYKTRFLDGEDYYNTYNYYKWDNGQNVIIKQGIYETRRNIPWIYWP